MLFAAGFGTRMGSLTANRPKPLISIAGKPLIDHALQIADAVGPSKIVINLHYLREQIERHLSGRDVVFSWERPKILDTGGGLKAAGSNAGGAPAASTRVPSRQRLPPASMPVSGKRSPPGANRPATTG